VANGASSRPLDPGDAEGIAVFSMTVVTETPLRRRLAGTPTVVVTRRLLPSVEQRMGELFDVTLNSNDQPMDRTALIEAMRSADVLVPTVTDRIDAGMIEAAGDRLGLIANFGAGIEHIDLAAARAHQIIVTNTPGVFTDDTADMTMALIISVPRRFAAGVRVLMSGQWSGWGPSGLLGHRLGGKTLAILGMGRIGQAVAHRARAFGLEVVYHNRHRLPPAVENMLGARYEADLDGMIARADILTLHCPAGPETHHILNAGRIAAMKPDAYVINTARGDLIDEQALIAALETGRLGGAGLDVFAHEPAVDPRLLALPNVVAMPHLGSATFEGREASGEKVIANIRFWADGHRPPDQVLEGWA
jgi:glyoxylate reductase